MPTISHSQLLGISIQIQKIFQNIGENRHNFKFGAKNKKFKIFRHSNNEIFERLLGNFSLICEKSEIEDMSNDFLHTPLYLKNFRAPCTL